MTTQADINTAYATAETLLLAHLERQLKQHRISRVAANAQVRAVRDGKRLTAYIADLGLTPDIVIDWLEREMERCEHLADQKSQTVNP